MTMVTVALWAWLGQAEAPKPSAATASQAAEALARGDAVAAATLAGKAIEANPADAWAHYNRAAALARL
jgi:hypothetical protein